MNNAGLSMHIRESTSQDSDAIREVHNKAFGELEGPIVSRLAGDILDDKTAMPLLSLVAEESNEIVGNIIFSSVTVENSQNNASAYILAPLAVIGRYQGIGIGKSLIKRGLDMLQARGAELIFVLGDPRYYSQSGFVPAMQYGLAPPYQLEYPDEAWMVLELGQGALENVTGVVRCAASLSSEEYW